jgi:hypothetical protein
MMSTNLELVAVNVHNHGLVAVRLKVEPSTEPSVGSRANRHVAAKKHKC